MEEDLHEEQDEKKQVRVIIPPPDIKTVVDKTATYVAKNGPSFEQLIMRKEQNNPKFNFLRYPDDPYRPYYMQKINELMPQKEPVQSDGIEVIKSGESLASEGGVQMYAQTST